jgi:LmbE family N-acetylglucosaminyl deacetylase
VQESNSVVSQEQQEPDIRRAMVIVAHPDDAEFASAGTVARWTREGREVIYVLCTSGDKGTSDRDLSPAQLAEIRRVEQRNACRVLGVEDVVFLGYEDGLLVSSLELRKDLVRQIRKYKPDAVICPDPTSRWYGQQYLNHPDHRAAGDAALDAVYPSARDPHVFPELLAEGLEPHKVREVYITSRDNADLWIDISETIDLKVAALHQHVSQIGDRHDQVDGWVREGAARVAEGQDMEYAESYKYIKLG